MKGISEIKVYNKQVFKETFNIDVEQFIDYKTLFDNGYNLYDIKKYIQYKNVKYLKCITCNKLYIIDWRDGYPKPLYDTKCLSDFGI